MFRWHSPNTIESAKRLNDKAVFGSALLDDGAIFPALHNGLIAGEVNACFCPGLVMAAEAVLIENGLDRLESGDRSLLCRGCFCRRLGLEAKGQRCGGDKGQDKSQLGAFLTANWPGYGKEKGRAPVKR